MVPSPKYFIIHEKNAAGFVIRLYDMGMQSGDVSPICGLKELR